MFVLCNILGRSVQVKTKSFPSFFISIPQLWELEANVKQTSPRVSFLKLPFYINLDQVDDFIYDEFKFKVKQRSPISRFLQSVWMITNISLIGRDEQTRVLPWQRRCCGWDFPLWCDRSINTVSWHWELDFKASGYGSVCKHTFESHLHIIRVGLKMVEMMSANVAVTRRSGCCEVTLNNRGRRLLPSNRLIFVSQLLSLPFYF